MRHARVRLEIVAEFRRSHLSRAAQDLLLTDGGRKNKSPQVPPLQERQLREERPQISSRVAAFSKLLRLPPQSTHPPTDRPAEPTGQNRLHEHRLNQATAVLSVKLHPPTASLFKTWHTSPYIFYLSYRIHKFWGLVMSFNDSMQ